jgi:DNA repair exonuclease SbcCD ATPase subunit
MAGFMRITRCTALNFGSFKEISFEYTALGLAIISGATGCGKSTLQNIPLWCLYGITAKNGAADDVRAWDVEEPTYAEVEVNLGYQTITVCRTRGKPSQNDLYWLVPGSGDGPQRGKDLIDTQKILVSLLTVTQEAYLTAACYNEFSPTATFFVDKARDRRELFERISDLSLPIQLSTSIVAEKKILRKEIHNQQSELDTVKGHLSGLIRGKTKTEQQVGLWEQTHQEHITQLTDSAENFDIEIKNTQDTLLKRQKAWDDQKAIILLAHNRDKEVLLNKLAAMDASKCPTCGHSKDPIDRTADKLESIEREIARVTKETNPVIEKIATINTENHYIKQLDKAKQEKNPYISLTTEIDKDITNCNSRIENITGNLSTSEREFSALEQLEDLAMQLRVSLLNHAVKSVERETNRYLETYFDSQLLVSFTLKDADTLEVILHKDSHECSFKQLSKGQRTLLKLCFAVSMMKAASDRLITSFNMLQFDEALDGLDDDLKVKAFRLFSELAEEHETILVIDHSEAIKNLFNRKFSVWLNTEGSHIDES